MDPRPPLNCDQHWTRKRKKRRENVKLETITCFICYQSNYYFQFSPNGRFFSTTRIVCSTVTDVYSYLLLSGGTRCTVIIWNHGNMSL